MSMGEAEPPMGVGVESMTQIHTAPNIHSPHSDRLSILSYSRRSEADKETGQRKGREDGCYRARVWISSAALAWVHTPHVPCWLFARC